MNQRVIYEAVQTYLVASTPDAVAKAVHESAAAGVPQSETDVLWSLAAALRDVLEKETDASA